MSGVRCVSLCDFLSNQPSLRYPRPLGYRSGVQYPSRTGNYVQRGVGWGRDDLFGVRRANIPTPDAPLDSFVTSDEQYAVQVNSSNGL